jgi:predicted GNAT family N-acyltransferase
MTEGAAPEIRRARLEEILRLRHEILRPGRPVETAHFDGDGEPETRHYGVFEGGRCVACATVVRRPWGDEPAWQLRGMATATDRRRGGFGRRLLARLEDDLRAHPVRRLWCNARVEAASFYRKHGWQVASDVFVVEDVGPHCRMTRSF